MYGSGISPSKVDIRLPGNGSSNSHGARPVHQKHRWIRTSRLSIKNSLSLSPSRVIGAATTRYTDLLFIPIASFDSKCALLSKLRPFIQIALFGLNCALLISHCLGGLPGRPGPAFRLQGHLVRLELRVEGMRFGIEGSGCIVQES